jgi:hypothetical protein
VFENMKDGEGIGISPLSKLRFTVGVNDDVSNLSLPLPSPPVLINHEGFF